MLIKITKEEVIQAMKTEPLAAGTFFHNSNLAGAKCSYLTYEVMQEKYSNNLGCPVCAVGAIIDTKVKEHNISLTDANIISKNIVTIPIGISPEYLISKGKYLSALSCLFESTCVPGISPALDHKYTTKKGLANYKTRRILIDFVRKNFPTELEIDTDEDSL